MMSNPLDVMTGAAPPPATAFEPRRAVGSIPEAFFPSVFVLLQSNITVEWCGGDTWAVVLHGNVWNGTSWERELLPAECDDAFLQRTRFTREEAFAQALAAERTV